MEIENKIYPIPILIKDLGMRFPTIHSKERKRYGLYKCPYCGKEFEARAVCIKNGHTRSCGCQSTKFNNPHGLRKHRIYITWRNMKDRCNNPKNKRYKDYGGRGIEVCERWLDVRNFIEDMLPSWEEGLSIDRIDVNGNYEPDNCRWTDANTQARNTREIYNHNTSGFRGVCWHKHRNKYQVNITVNGTNHYLGLYASIIEAAKVYERYIRMNNLEHNFTPVLSDIEIEELNRIINGN